MLAELRYEDFEPLIGKTFGVESAGSWAQLEVKTVERLPPSSPRAAPPFHLILLSREGWRAEQGMFRLDHPTRGALELFAVPLGPDEGGQSYQIIFN